MSAEFETIPLSINEEFETFPLVTISSMAIPPTKTLMERKHRVRQWSAWICLLLVVIAGCIAINVVFALHLASSAWKDENPDCPQVQGGFAGWMTSVDYLAQMSHVLGGLTICLIVWIWSNHNLRTSVIVFVIFMGVVLLKEFWFDVTYEECTDFETEGIDVSSYLMGYATGALVIAIRVLCDETRCCWWCSGHSP